MKGKMVDGGPEQLPYKMEVQKRGISLPNDAFRPVGSPANPVHNPDPGLGAKTIAHPFKKGKQHI
jgi:hypothetical protein